MRVGHGSTLVGQAGRTMQDLVSAIRRVTDALDAERIAIREALGYRAPHFPLADHYAKAGDEWMYGRRVHQKLTDSGDWRERIVLTEHRYMLEDVAFGLAFLVSKLDAGTVREICRAASDGGVVEPSNFNGPGQIVIAGDDAAVQGAIARAKAAGAKRAVLLPVSAPGPS